MGKIKEKLIEEYMSKPITVGMKGSYEYESGYSVKTAICTVKKIIDSENIQVLSNEGYTEKPIVIPSKIFKRKTYDIGNNPFVIKEWESNIKTLQYDIEGILLHCGISILNMQKQSHNSLCKVFGVNIPEINFNPYIIDKNGKKEYYQRDFVWTLENKQLLINSIYNNFDCGSIIIRTRSFEYIENEIKSGNTELAFNDIVDGKQRLCTLIDFINDKFADSHGNYFSDLSDLAQNKFRRSMCFKFKIIGETATDLDCISAFLNVNFTGIPVSKEHIQYVKEIYNKIK